MASLRHALLLIALAACSSSETPGTAASPPPPSPPPPLPPATPVTPAAPGEVLTSKNDNGRTGANLHETVLDRARARSLKHVATFAVDGEVYAQPLVAVDVATPMGTRSLAIIATMNDSLYAFDVDAPDGTPPVWHAGAAGELGHPGASQRNVNGPNGILSTPVIARGPELVYLVARDCSTTERTSFDRCGIAMDVPRCEERLHSVDLRTGAVVTSVTIGGAVVAADKAVHFDPSVQWNRPALLLAGDELTIGFGSGPNAANDHEEDFEYHGWVFRYDVRALDRAPAVFASTPRTGGGSVWQAGAGPAADDDAIYFVTANDTYGCSTHAPSGFPEHPTDAEDSVVRLPHGFASNDFVAASTVATTENGSVSVYGDAKSYADTRPYTAMGYTGTVFQYTSSGDNGFGSSGPTLIPGSRDLVVGTKGGILYLLDRDTMLPRQAPISPFDVLPLQGDHTLHIHSWWGIPVVPGSLVFHRVADDRGLVYAWPMGDRLRSFRYDYAAHTLGPERISPTEPAKNGGNLSLSANGMVADTSIVWATTVNADPSRGNGRFVAFDGTTLEELYSDALPSYSKFTPPTVARGKVLVPAARAGERTEVRVYAAP